MTSNMTVINEEQMDKIYNALENIWKEGVEIVQIETKFFVYLQEINSQLPLCETEKEAQNYGIGKNVVIDIQVRNDKKEIIKTLFLPLLDCERARCILWQKKMDEKICKQKGNWFDYKVTAKITAKDTLDIRNEKSDWYVGIAVESRAIPARSEQEAIDNYVDFTKIVHKGSVLEIKTEKKELIYSAHH